MCRPTATPSGVRHEAGWRGAAIPGWRRARPARDRDLSARTHVRWMGDAGGGDLHLPDRVARHARRLPGLGAAPGAGGHATPVVTGLATAARRCIPRSSAHPGRPSPTRTNDRSMHPRIHRARATSGRSIPTTPRRWTSSWRAAPRCRPSRPGPRTWALIGCRGCSTGSGRRSCSPTRLRAHPAGWRRTAAAGLLHLPDHDVTGNGLIHARNYEAALWPVLARLQCRAEACRPVLRKQRART